MLDADTIVANRQLRQRLGLWRVIAIFAAAAALIVVVLWSAEKTGGLSQFSGHIARIRVDGVITGGRPMLDLLARIDASDRVKAVIVHIDSPGGTTAGSEAVYLGLRKIAAKKPVVSVMGSFAASGGYITAIGGDHIIARGNTITGSIGVIFQWAEITQLLERIGVKMQEIKSSELKAEPNMFKPLTEEARRATDIVVQDSYKWFVGLVAERRPFDAAEAQRLADGRVYSGRQALENKLVDALGGEDEAKEWLVAEHGIDKDMQVVDWRPKRNLDDTPLGFSLLVGLLRWFGIDLGDPIAVQVQRLKLDGLLSVWHPEL